METLKAIHSITGEVLTSYISVVVDYYNGVFIYGFVRKGEEVKATALRNSRTFTVTIAKDSFKDRYFWSVQHNSYVLYLGGSKEKLVSLKYMKKTGFPYSFDKRYEAAESFKLFAGKQAIVANYDFPLSKYLKYTFGIEFETCLGIIPEQLCYRDGLIPLRDGSIAGNEYSTVVLSGNNGLSLLYQQLQTLRAYTHFNKECSLHMHFGGFPIDSQKLFRLYQICQFIEPELKTILPEYTFCTSKYKSTGKDYCKCLPRYSSFESLYNGLVGIPYENDLLIPHPLDEYRGHKWNVTTRYYWLNIINMICYPNHKTVEFRFLRPTYNLERILFWIYTFNAILLYAESELSVQNRSLIGIYSAIYPPEVAGMLEEEYYKQFWTTQQQDQVYDDKIGAVTEIENDFFGFDNII